MGLLSAYEAPPGEFVLHVTGEKNVPSIRENGLQRHRPLGADTETIATALDRADYTSPFPFDRTAVTYFHVDPEYVEWALEPKGEIFAEEVAIVVAVDELPRPMYVANMSIISDIIDLCCGGRAATMWGETPEEIVSLYRDSITEVRTPEEIAAPLLSSDPEHAELVVDGDVPPAAIVDVVHPL